MKGQKLVLFATFWLIAMGLGYPILNRYDPTTVPGLGNAEEHAATVTGEPTDVRNRILVPYLAKPLYRLARGRVGTWDPVMLALLIVGAAFVAGATALLIEIGEAVGAEPGASLVAGLLYLLNFDVANYQLGASTDPSGVFMLVAAVAALLAERWSLLPLLAVGTALTKEAFVPVFAAFLLGWWAWDARQRGLQRRQAAWTAAAVLAAFATFAWVMRRTSGVTVVGYLANEMDAQSARAFFIPGLVKTVFNHSFLYVFAWLLPLGLPRLRELPGAWLAACVSGIAATFAFGAYHDAEDSAARTFFYVAGPALSLSAALLLTRAKALLGR